MNAAELASQLNGTEYPFHPDQDIRQKAKESGLVIVYGASDDLMELDGAIYDEVEVLSNKKVLVHKGGVLGSKDDLETDEEIEQWLNNKKNSRAIEAIWLEDGYSWSYRTDIPHATFEIIEGNEKYCRGMVVDLKDI